MSIDIGFNGYLLRVLPNWQHQTAEDNPIHSHSASF